MKSSVKLCTQMSNSNLCVSQLVKQILIFIKIFLCSFFGIPMMQVPYFYKLNSNESEFSIVLQTKSIYMISTQTDLTRT